MNRTGIEWADYTWNPIVGCEERCGATEENPEGWCYARAQAKRRKPGVRDDGTAYGCQLCYEFAPHLHGERLDQPQRIKSSRIVFADSMGDWWSPGLDPEARRLSFAAMTAAPWHHYVLLTKRPDLIDPEELWDHTAELGDADRGPGGLWLGVSITRDEDWWRVERLLEIREQAPHPILVSFEPLLGPIEHEIPRKMGWVIVGAQTGPGAVAPERAWLRGIWLSTRPWAPVFEKDNLASVMPRKLFQRWPEPMMLETGGVAAR